MSALTPPQAPIAPSHSRPPEEKKSGLATAAMVLGIIGVVFGFIPILGMLSLPLGIIGLILGLVAIKAMKSGRAGKSVTVAGIVTSIIAVVLFFAQGALWSKAVDEVSKEVAKTTAAPTPPSKKSEKAGGGAARTIKAGTFEVGTEIKPGTYKTDGGDLCYYERLRDLNGGVGSIITNEIVQGQGIMQIKKSDAYIKVSGTCTWTLKG